MFLAAAALVCASSFEIAGVTFLESSTPYSNGVDSSSQVDVLPQATSSLSSVVSTYDSPEKTPSTRRLGRATDAQGPERKPVPNVPA